MSRKIPSLKPSRVIRTLVKLGFAIHHRTGSRVRSKHPETGRTLTIARYDRFEPWHVVAQKTLRQGDIAEDEFLGKL
jgi:predicted RNA binding protein YcfA (HicA-like mRNA interferase family)